MMKPLNKYILEKLIINKNFKNIEIDNIIDLITDGKMNEMLRNGMEWGYRLEHNSLTPKDLLESIEKNIKQIYSSISVDVNEHLDKGLGVIVVSSFDNAITFYKSLLDENRIIALSIYELSPQFRRNRKINNASTTVSAMRSLLIRRCCASWKADLIRFSFSRWAVAQPKMDIVSAKCSWRVAASWASDY